jgi:hypothetical protein
MENKQTAVEWFYQRILAKDIKSVFEQAKAMEKEQIVEAYNAGQAKEASQCFWTKGNLYFDNIYGGHN